MCVTVVLHLRRTALAWLGLCTEVPRYRSTFTGSLTSDVYSYQYENGRRYHAYDAGRKCRKSIALL